MVLDFLKADTVASVFFVANEPPQILSAAVTPDPFPGNTTFRAEAIVTDPNGLADIANVKAWFSLPAGELLGPFSMVDEGAGVWALEIPNLAPVPSGQYLFIPLVTDQSGATDYVSSPFSAP